MTATLAEYADGREAARMAGLARGDQVWRAIARHATNYAAETGQMVEVAQIGQAKAARREDLAAFLVWREERYGKFRGSRASRPVPQPGPEPGELSGGLSTSPGAPGLPEPERLPHAPTPADSRPPTPAMQPSAGYRPPTPPDEVARRRRRAALRRSILYVREMQHADAVEAAALADPEGGRGR